jgi:hypothetical protein
MTRLPYRRLCETMEVPYHRFRRWRNRVEDSLPALSVPGPKKTMPFNLESLNQELKGLSHGPKRTKGVGILYSRYYYSLSRRDLGNLVEKVRQAQRQERMREMTRVEWLEPGMVWAIDGTECGELNVPKGSVLQTVRDLCTKYYFKSLPTFWKPCGKENGDHLSEQFHVHGAPLVQKMDNAKNFLCKEVRDVMEEYGVIPLISPPEYPQYNGSLEKAQGDIKEAIRKLLPLGRTVTETEFALCAWLAAHELNHKPRRILKGQTPCQALGGGKNPANLTIRERRIIYDCVKETCGSILSEIDDPSEKQIANAWRESVEWWLEKEGVIRLTRNGKSVTLL